MQDVETYYDQRAAAEWTRLERHRTEFAVTLRALHQYLPAPPARLLDVGGGPGRYAIALAQRGYDVTLVDLSAACLALAQEKAHAAGVRRRDAIHANAVDLSSVPGRAYDAVLLMGPLYHLVEHDDRRRAVDQAWGKLSSGGVVIAAFISRFAFVRSAAASAPNWVIENRAYAERLAATGWNDQPTEFTYAYFAHPTEIAPFMEAAGFATLNLIGCEGIVAGHEEQVNQLQGEAWDIWADLNFRLGQDPALHGAADHILYIGRKPFEQAAARP